MHSFLYNFVMYSITSYENKELITIENSNTVASPESDSL